MKSTSSYLILLVSFIGLLLLQQYENRNNQKVLHEQNQKTKIDQTVMENKLGELEVAVDSLLELVNNQSTIELGEAKPFVEPLKELYQSESVPGLDHQFITLDEAVRVRDSKNELSQIAQQDINLAYEMGGETWYGAEEIWNTDIFKKRSLALRKKE
tara:strand:+ start:62 stop:532 length:471 start_codon:yes stop_codon:yes gene_type:complete